MSDERRARKPPFRGLSTFAEGDSESFAGRDAESVVTVANFLAHSISVVYGPSGVGKSSLLQAGVMPRLRTPRRGRANTVVFCSAWAEGSAPALRAALADAGLTAGSDGGEDSLDADLAAAARHAGGRLLVILDQFEEQFAGGRAPDLAFARAIDGAARNVSFLISIREDALAELDRFRGEIRGLFDHLIRIDHLGVDAARDAIERPVAVWNANGPEDESVTLDARLVDDVLADVQQPDPKNGMARVQAPLLQLVMARLWQDAVVERGERALRADALRRLGGGPAILDAHVGGALDACTAAEKDAAAAMFEFMVTPSYAKIPQSAADLATSAFLPEGEAVRVLERLTGGERILESAGRARYQLSHDALGKPVLEWRRRWLAVRSQQRRRRGQRRRLFAIVLFTAALLCVAALIHALSPLEAATVGARFELAGTRTPPRDVVLVAIDDDSLERLHETSLPLPRRAAATAIDWIAGGRPKVIAYDVDFSGRRPDDDALAEAILNADHRVVLASLATAPGGRTNVLGGDAFLRSIGSQAGYSGFTTDTTGAIRRLTYEVDGVRSFAAKAAQVATGDSLPRSRFAGAWLDYYGPAGTLRSVPFWKVAGPRGQRAPQALFRDKIVVVGVSIPAAGDLHPVWGTHRSDMTGLEIQATAIDSVRRGLPLRDVPVGLTLLTIVILALVAPLLGVRFGLGITLAVAVVIGLLYLAVALAAFLDGWVVQVVAPLAALVLASFAVSLVRIAAPDLSERRPVA